MIHEDLSGKIIGTAMELLNELKPGLDEKLYERAMIFELTHRGHTVSVQSSFSVSYRGELIGNLIPGLIVDDAIIVDPKVVSCFTDACGSNDRISQRNALGVSTPSKFQERTPRMEASRARAGRKVWSSRPSCLINSYPRHPRNPRF